MRPNPRQTDLEDLLHYQNDPHFIGPRLPTDHSAYRAYFLERAKSKPTEFELKFAFGRWRHIPKT